MWSAHHSILHHFLWGCHRQLEALGACQASMSLCYSPLTMCWTGPTQPPRHQPQVARSDLCSHSMTYHIFDWRHQLGPIGEPFQVSSWMAMRTNYFNHASTCNSLRSFWSLGSSFLLVRYPLKGMRLHYFNAATTCVNDGIGISITITSNPGSCSSIRRHVEARQKKVAAAAAACKEKLGYAFGLCCHDSLRQKVSSKMIAFHKLSQTHQLCLKGIASVFLSFSNTLFPWLSNFATHEWCQAKECCTAKNPEVSRFCSLLVWQQIIGHAFVRVFYCLM